MPLKRILEVKLGIIKDPEVKGDFNNNTLYGCIQFSKTTLLGKTSLLLTPVLLGQEQKDALLCCLNSLV